jgi:tetratricopeptide (TPR) repeat protein
VAWVQSRAKRYDDARQSYQELLDKYEKTQDPPGVREVLRDARIAISNLCVMQDKPAEAEEWLERVLDEFPEDVGALNDLGYLWADQGKHLNRSLEMTKKAVAAEPDNVAYLDSLGWAYFRLGQFDKAVEYLEKATQDEDPDGVLLDHLGDAYAGAKQTDKALTTWRRAVSAFEKDAEAEQLEKTKRKIEKLTGDKPGK